MKNIQLVLGVALLTLVCGCKLGGGGGGSGSPSSSVTLVSSESVPEQGMNETAYIADLDNETFNDTSSDERRQAPAAIPEPATMITLGLGAAALFLKRGRR